MNILIVLAGFVVTLLTGNFLFAVFSVLWIVFNLIDKKPNNETKLTNGFVTGVKTL